MEQNFCPTCGAELQFKDAEICPKCGVRIKSPPKPAEEPYAGFWIRFGAWLIDTIILLIVGFVILFILVAGALIGSLSTIYTPALFYTATFTGTAAVGLLLWWISLLAINWIYYAYQESSPKQATLGKQVFGLIVTNTNGERISFARASGRWAGRILSGMIFCIGYIMIAFTEKKQGLHDMIADTLVVYKAKVPPK
ncbi:MAG: RDD family protein [Methanoregulaceae archaeon]